MKHDWTDEELLEHWTLSETELQLLANKTEIGRLGFAVLLKFFRLTARLPRQTAQVPLRAVEFVARQLKSAPGLWRQYEWGGRNFAYHRQEIRKFFGFRKATAADLCAALEYLCQDILPSIVNCSRQLFYLGEFFRQAKIELPTAKRQERILRSARIQFEKQLTREISRRLEPASCDKLLRLLALPPAPEVAAGPTASEPGLSWLKSDLGQPNLKQVFTEMQKLAVLRDLHLPGDLFAALSPAVVENLRRRLAVEAIHELRRHPLELKLTLLAAFACCRQFEVTDNLVDLLLYLIHKIQTRAEKKVAQEMLQEIKRVAGKHELLFRLAESALAHPEGVVREVLFAVVNEQTLQDVVKEHQAQGGYQRQVATVMRASYGFHYRRMTPYLLQTLKFRSNNEKHRPVLAALTLISRYAGKNSRFFRLDEEVPLDGVVKKVWLEQVFAIDAKGRTRIDRQQYEISVLQALRDGLRCKEIWVEEARRFRNPDEDVPADFATERENYYRALAQPISAEEFTHSVKERLQLALTQFNNTFPNNETVQLLLKNNNSHIALSPLAANLEPPNLRRLKRVIAGRWRMTNLLDVLKETDLRVNFTASFKSPTGRENLSADKLQKRLLLCLYGLGTNTGLKRMSAGAGTGENYADLLYARQRFITKDALRTAIQQVVNATLQRRQESLWGEGTTTCASDSKKFGSYDQNLRTEWHLRYGGRGVMIYWHVERRAVCIYAQLKTCSSSEAAAMIEGLLRHDTDMEVAKNYVDSHGQSEVAFAFCHLLNFHLMPRLKAIHKQKLYRPDAGNPDAFPHLQTALTRPINWALIERHYDEMVKYATALKLGTADTESILRRFTRNNLQHPTYKALAELGKAIKTTFLCDYLSQESVRREIQEGLNIVELWNSVNDFIFFGKGGEFASNNLEDQEITMLCLHLVQISLAYVNTLMIEQVLSEPEWQNQLTEADRRALTPLIYGHINPYGRFHLDLKERLQLDPQVIVE